MTVSAIGPNDGSSRLNTIIKSTAVGTAAGYAAKWLWPIQKQERAQGFRDKIMTGTCYKNVNDAKVDEFRKSGSMTRAQEAFVKMVESRDKDAFKRESINKKVLELGGENSQAGKEYRNIINTVNESAAKMKRLFTVSENIMLRYIRPAVPFLVAGAGIGFFTGFAHNVMRCDYDA